MKLFAQPILAVSLLAVSLCLFGSACSTLKSEFGLTPTPAMTSTNDNGQIQITPPVVPQLDQAAAVAGAVLPPPWGSIVSGALTLMASGAAAFATFHARKTVVAATAQKPAGFLSQVVAATNAKT